MDKHSSVLSLVIKWYRYRSLFQVHRSVSRHCLLRAPCCTRLETTLTHAAGGTPLVKIRLEASFPISRSSSHRHDLINLPANYTASIASAGNMTQDEINAAGIKGDQSVAEYP